MPDTRKLELDVELINRLLPILEAEFVTSEQEEENARIIYEQAKSKRIKASAHLLQMRGDAAPQATDTDSNNLEPDVDANSSIEAREAQYTKIETEIGQALDNGSVNGVPTNEKPSETEVPFWEAPGFQWRRFLPELIEKENRFMNIGDVLFALDLAPQQRAKHYPTISSALSVLAKDGEKIVAHVVPGIRGQLYGLPSFFDEDGKVKHEHVDNLLKRRIA